MGGENSRVDYTFSQEKGFMIKMKIDSESYYEISMASEENEGCLRKLVEEVKRLNLSAKKS